MVNRVNSYSLRGIEMFLKVPVIIIIRFGENNLLGTIYVDIYQFQRWARGLHGSPYVYCLLFIKVNYLFIIHKSELIIIKRIIHKSE